MDTLLSIFRATKGSISSKRVFGGLGFIVVILCYIDAHFSTRTMPEFTGEILTASTVLLGTDAVTKMFKKEEDE